MQIDKTVWRQARWNHSGTFFQQYFSKPLFLHWSWNILVDTPSTNQRKCWELKTLLPFLSVWWSIFRSFASHKGPALTVVWVVGVRYLRCEDVQYILIDPTWKGVQINCYWRQSKWSPKKELFRRGQTIEKRMLDELISNSMQKGIS